MKITPVIVDYDAITPYGESVDILWQGLLTKQTAITDIDRFDATNFTSRKAATIKNISPKSGKTLVIQMLEKLKDNINKEIPRDADLILASLNGEIEFVEKEVLSGQKVGKESRLDFLIEKTGQIFGVNGNGMVVSAACASSSIAIARAGAFIASGKSNCVLVVACDCVSEFVMSGFSSIRALDEDFARPFDKNRAGINIGESVAYILLMSQERAEKENRNILAKLIGWGMSCDANHMTGPSKEGEGLCLAIKRSLDVGGVSLGNITSICAHGTGTVYNDAMEIKAFKKIFTEDTCPAYSIKGGIGHTMGSAGIMDAIIALKTMQENILPPTVGLKEIDEEALGWISNEKVELNNDVVLSTNSGFGGINAALVLGC